MVKFSVDESNEVSVAEEPVAGGDPASAAAGHEELPHGLEEPAQERVERSSERDELLEKVRRLELELERYRAHAERTSKLFLSATNYAEWVRESARRDAEVALRKASARVEKLNTIASELEQTESELARARTELARLQTLTDETRARLSTFLTAGLQALNTEVVHGPEPARGDLQDTLQRQLASTSVPVPAQLADVERSEG